MSLKIPAIFLALCVAFSAAASTTKEEMSKKSGMQSTSVGVGATGADDTSRGYYGGGHDGGYGNYGGHGGGHHGHGDNHVGHSYHQSYPHHGGWDHGGGFWGIDVTTGLLILLVLGAVCYPLFGFGGYGGHGRAGNRNGEAVADWAIRSFGNSKDFIGMAEKVLTSVEKLYETYSKGMEGIKKN